jgi:hydrogenase maturation protease
LENFVYSKLAVVGVGNILMHDDGLGVRLVEEIVKHSLLPESVRCIDGGTASFRTLDACGDCNHIIVVDAVAAGGKPGTVYKMGIEKWHGLKGISLHDAGLLDAVYMSQMFQGDRIRVTVIGMEPGDISPGLGLSHAVKERFKDLIKCVLDEVSSVEGRPGYIQKK